MPVEGEDGRVRKQPYYTHRKTKRRPSPACTNCCRPKKAKDDPDRWLWSATIVATDARGPAGEVHDRTPLILRASGPTPGLTRT
jgi:putative SOS response-associated peptidase YedK